MHRDRLFFFLLFSCLLCASPAWAAVCRGMDGGPGDLDGDGFVASADCDDEDSDLWSSPAEASNLRVPAGNRHKFVWDSFEYVGATPTGHDLLRSSVASNFLDHPSVTCIEPSGLDHEATDLTVPTPGVVFFYLARGRNNCGPGTLGARSNGVEREGRDCDCSMLCDDGNACTEDTCDDGACAHADVPPALLLAPAGTAVCSGQTARFSAVARGSGALSYQWSKNGAPIGNNAPVLEHVTVQGDNGAQIAVQVTDSCTSAASAPAVLTVFADPDSCAGGLDGQEAPNGAGDFLGHAVSVGVRLYSRGGSSYNNKSGGGGSGGVGGGVHLHSGELYLDATDLAIAGRGLDFLWTRYYRSREWRSTSMGVGWTHRYDRRVEPDPMVPGNLLVHSGDSRIDSYAPNALGCWEAPGFFRDLCPEPGGGYVLTFADKTTWTFAPLDGSPVAGRIIEVRDSNANAGNLTYDSTGRLVTITDSLGRDIEIAYNARNLVSTVTDFRGRQVQYEYYDGLEPGGELDDLKSVTSPAVVGTITGNNFPNGKTTHYTYTQGSPIGELNHNLLTITDPEGNVLLRNAYSSADSPADPRFDRVDRQIFPEGVATYVYVALGPGDEPPAVSQTVVKDPMGNVTAYSFAEDRKLLGLKEYTGRTPQPALPTDGTFNAPTGQLRTSDPPYFETRYEYNNDYLPTRVLHPDGSSVELTFDVTVNLNPREQGDLVQRVRLPGSLGGDQTEIVETWTHATDFGTSYGDATLDRLARPAINEGLFITNEFLNSRKGWDGTIKGVPKSSHLRKGWDGTIKGLAAGDLTGDGLPDVVSMWEKEQGRKGWDGTIKGHLRGVVVRDIEECKKRPLLAARASPGNFPSDLFRIRPKGWDGTIKGRLAESLMELPYDPPTAVRPPSNVLIEFRASGVGVLTAEVGDEDNAPGCGSDQQGNIPAGEVQDCAPNVYRSGWGHPLPEIDTSDDSLSFSRKGWDGTIKGRSHPTSHTDGRGNTWTLAYDAGGNLTDVTAPPVVTGTLGGGVQTIHHEWSYNGSGQVTQYTSPEGRIDQYHYYTSGPATGYLQDVVVDAANVHQVVVTARDDCGNVTRVTEPGGATTDYTLNELDQVVRVISSAPFSYPTYFYYDKNDRMTRMDVQNIDAQGFVVASNGHLTTFVGVEPLDQLVFGERETAPGQCVREELYWDANGNPTLWRSGEATNGSQPTNVVRALHDERGLRYRLIDAEGDPAQATVQFDYNANGRLVTLHEWLEDPLGPRVSTASRDGYGRVVTATDPEGNSATFHYDASSNPTSVEVEGELIEGVSGTNVTLAQADCVYDEIDRPVVAGTQHFDPATGTPIGDGSSTTRMYYDLDSFIQRIEDDNLHATDYEYDTASRLSVVTDAAGNSRTFTTRRAARRKRTSI